MKKEETVITLINGGMHSQRAYVRMKDMLINNEYINPRLYHIVLMGSEDLREYQSALKSLCAELAKNNIPTQWKSCLEIDNHKRLHIHVFLLVEAKYKNPCSIINGNEQGWLNVMLSKRELRYHIAQPKNPIHQTGKGKILNYATLAGEKLADCLIWISYLVKNRSKPDIEHIYFGSRKKGVV